MARTFFTGTLHLLVMSVVLFILTGDARAQDRIVYSDMPLSAVLAEFKELSNYHFLYRDALIAGKRIDLTTHRASLLVDLDDALEPLGLRLHVDEGRNQVLVLERTEVRQDWIVRGIVLDDDDGAALPYAGITWQDDGRARGTAADESGTFTLRFASETDVEVTFSYLGYASRSVRLDKSVESLPVRLDARSTFAQEIVVSTAALRTEVDTSWHHLLQSGTFSALGESGVVRSLQALPSVAIGPAASAGLNVRGSRADGFQILLDDMSVYSQSHFFGLFDAFNADALQAVGLYYGVAPATLQGPPGGTLSFVTRTGSQAGVRGKFGVSNTSSRLTLDGPLLDGRGSWLLSGRRSHLNWLGNDAFIGLGLDVGRETEVPIGPLREVPVAALATGNASAHFFDLHGKLLFEWPGGTRLTLGGYAGGDESEHDADRLVNDARLRDPIRIQANTRNEWGNAAASTRLQTPLGSRMVVTSILGLSRYSSAFSKDDFAYTDPTRSLIADTSRHSIRPFQNENELLEIKLSQELDIAARENGTWTAGIAMHRYQIDYEEASALRNAFRSTHRSTQTDFYTQYEAAPAEALTVLAGVRSHYFSLGRFFRLSPRLRVRLFPDRRVSVGAGYSRNHQLIHRLYVEQSTHADLWVMSTPGQPPASVDHVNGGVYVRLTPTTFAQVEAYRKTFKNLREHETSAARRRFAPGSPLLDPWLHDNDGLAHGIEVMLRHSAGPALWTTSYTLSEMELQNARVNDGTPYPADWDRRHQFTSHLRMDVTEGFQVHLIWAFASGTPNALAHADQREAERLPAYHRMDAGVQFQRGLGGGVLAIEATMFNLYDRSNTWYRRPVPVVAPGPEGRRVGLLNVDVYDLGLRPALDVSYRF